MKKKVLIGIIVVVALAVTGYVVLKKEPSKEIQWDTKPITRGSISNSITATGTVQADTTIQVGTQASGIISKLFIDYNSKVKKVRFWLLLTQQHFQPMYLMPRQPCIVNRFR